MHILLFSTSGIFGLFLLILLLIALLAGTVAFFAKNEDVKLLSGLFAGGIVLFVVITWVNDQVTIVGITELYEARVIGHYVLDTSSSEMAPYPPMQYADLRLELNKDNTFRFSRAVPFISGTYGKWEYKVNGDGAYSEFIFKDNVYPANNRFNFSADGDVVSIRYPTPQYAKEQVEMLVFKRTR